VSGLLELVPCGVPLALFLDYDGTLVPIRRTPALARLGPMRRAELEWLARRTSVAVVSGRPLAEIRRMVGVPRLVYAGNHGLEIWSRGRKWVHPEAARRSLVMARMASAIRTLTRGVPGILVEDKGLTLSVHYRRVPRWRRAALRRAVAEKVRTAPPGLRLAQGKMVLEIRPDIAWDKGWAVRELLRRAPGPRRVFPIYLGDDRTDEDAFRALRGRGLTVRVGPSGQPTEAGRRLRGVDEVWAFLAALRRRLAAVPPR
jgi:trehalose 6-phosphate phosphatase